LWLNIGLRISCDRRPPSFSHGRSIERDAVGTVDQAVEDVRELSARDNAAADYLRERRGRRGQGR
jgi:hypothetical protein